MRAENVEVTLQSEWDSRSLKIWKPMQMYDEVYKGANMDTWLKNEYRNHMTVE
jgi:hypothetical protein